MNSAAINSIIVDAPNCLHDLAVEPGITTMHVYLSNYDMSCP